MYCTVISLNVYHAAIIIILYCDIPKCTPGIIIPQHIFFFDAVDGQYGNWSLNSTCNVSCGDGFETWSRKCNNPAPKYGGRNCRHLGEAVEHTPCTKKPCVGKYA